MAKGFFTFILSTIAFLLAFPNGYLEAMSSPNPTPLLLEVEIYRLKGVDFSDDQIQSMLQRTNSKLEPASIRVSLKKKTIDVDIAGWSYITNDNIERILETLGSSKTLRIFLIKKNLSDDIESWTYDPVIGGAEVDHWRGAVFIAEKWADNSDKNYFDQGYMASNDSLQHELGHVLMQEADHQTGGAPNFFHEHAEKSDATMTKEQILRMRKSPYLIPDKKH